MKLLNKANVAKVQNRAGIYTIYNESGKREYVGTSKVLRHRLQSYYQDDDFNVNKTKRALRPHAKKFDVQYLPIMRARKKEKGLKRKLPHNKR